MKNIKIFIASAGIAFLIILLLEYCSIQKYRYHYNINNNYKSKKHSFKDIDKIDDDIKLICVIFCTKKQQKCEAISKTWSKKCDKVVFWPADTRQQLTIQSESPLLTFQGGFFTSSFHNLCECIRTLVDNYSDYTWSIFVKDDMFVIPENAKWLISYSRRHSGQNSHYLGHSQTLWGTEYNWASAGFILSMHVMNLLADRFNSSKSCATGGKYWKQEDYYLGKHLENIDIRPIDSRDNFGFSTFLGYDLEKMMFPGSNVKFSNYYSKTLHPVKCCGSRTVTFPVLSYTDMYKFYYMVYGVQIYEEDSGEKRFPKRLKSDDYVWKDFLLEKGLSLNISAKEYETLWYTKFGNATALPKLDHGEH